MGTLKYATNFGPEGKKGLYAGIPFITTGKGPEAIKGAMTKALETVGQWAHINQDPKKRQTFDIDPSSLGDKAEAFKKAVMKNNSVDHDRSFYPGNHDPTAYHLEVWQ